MFSRIKNVIPINREDEWKTYFFILVARLNRFVPPPPPPTFCVTPVFFFPHFFWKKVKRFPKKNTFFKLFPHKKNFSPPPPPTELCGHPGFIFSQYVSKKCIISRQIILNFEEGGRKSRKSVSSSSPLDNLKLCWNVGKHVKNLHS